jgi:hypothetical protein
MKNIDALCTRKQFLIGSSVAAVGLFCGRGLLQAQSGSSPASSATPESADNVPDFPEHHPQFDRTRVKRFVIAGHVNLPAVKAMLAEEPNLINGAIDWGNGDFETALAVPLIWVAATLPNTCSSIMRAWTSSQQRCSAR